MTAARSDRTAARPGARAAEARRNRQNLLDVATRAFAESDGPVSLAAIARAAGVGIATLYRHFPTRDALVEAVYADQMQRLHRAAEHLLAERSPAAALHAWLPVFADWAATKHGMVDSLRGLLSSGRLDRSGMRAHLVQIVARLLTAGAQTGELRGDIAAEDVAAAFAAVLTVTGDPGGRAQTVRLLELIADGLRPIDTGR